MPTDFEGQADLVWSHMETILREADMAIDDLVSLRFYLAHASLDPANVEMLKRLFSSEWGVRCS